jgi:osmotically-inducible protein OsmY
MSHTATHPEPTRRTDSDIHQDVAREFASDARVSADGIALQVERGVVTLIGTVESWAKLRAAEEAAHRVPGVLDVANELTVLPQPSSSRTDTEIAHAVRQTLEWDVLVPDRHLQSTISRGIVTLEGKVSSWAQRADAERAIERLTGVRGVVNRIHVETRDPFDLEHARRAVAHALQRHAERDAARIDLASVNGTVTVMGVVHSWQERDAVLGAVRGMRGVRAVDDHLRIERMRP